MKRRLVTGILCVVMSLGCLNSVGAEDVVEIPAPVVQELGIPGISTYSEEIIWVIKRENGKTYRRLFNTTTGEFIGDWILC